MDVQTIELDKNNVFWDDLDELISELYSFYNEIGLEITLVKEGFQMLKNTMKSMMGKYGTVFLALLNEDNWCRFYP